MKRISISILFFLFGIVFQLELCALQVQVVNLSGMPVNIKPLWTNGPKDWVLLSGQNEMQERVTSNFYAYNSYLYHIKGLQVMLNNDRSCVYTYNLDAYNLRGTGSISLIIGSNKNFNTVMVQGHTDMVRKGATYVNFDVQKQLGSCNKYQ